ncbi:MAG: aminoglycoside N(3)-acetyltransferase [Thomasclavelia sp.]
MSELEAMKLVKMPNTKNSLVNDLKKLGVLKGDMVLMHASLSKLGWIVGREVTVIDAILETIGDTGTLIMPSFTGDNSAPELWQAPPVDKEWVEIIKNNMPAYDPKRTPTREMGKVVDALLRYPGCIRSRHPQVSFCGYGKEAKYILKDHALSPGLGDGSPLKKLYDCHGKILLLGVGYENCTALHLSESHLPNLPWINTGACVLKDGQRKWLDFKEISYDDSDFKVLGQAYEKETEVIKGYVGAALCRYIDLKDLVDFGEKWLKKQR